ncbi:Uncharacterised protein [Sphingobacterium daejeonense]|nr:Uncharacterised protein [Sphingobacterium daejeonense]
MAAQYGDPAYALYERCDVHQFAVTRVSKKEDIGQTDRLVDQDIPGLGQPWVGGSGRPGRHSRSLESVFHGMLCLLV